MSIAYHDGDFLGLDEVRISPLDRGFLLGDGVYEVIPVYAGRAFHLDDHLDRLARSLAGLRIPDPHPREAWRDLLGELVERNGGGEQALYLQVTRGVAPRNHAFPPEARPTVFAMTRAVTRPAEPAPIAAITRTDYRWQRCDLKTIALVANALLRQEAVEAGAGEAILLRDGQVTEGAAANVFVVDGDFIVTPPKGPHILPGITRDVLVALLRDADLPVVEAPVTEGALRGAGEIWVTSSSLEVTPVVRLDGEPVGGARPGPVWRKALRLFDEHKASVAAARA